MFPIGLCFVFPLDVLIIDLFLGLYCVFPLHVLFSKSQGGLCRHLLYLVHTSYVQS